MPFLKLISTCTKYTLLKAMYTPTNTKAQKRNGVDPLHASKDAPELDGHIDIVYVCR